MRKKDRKMFFLNDESENEIKIIVERVENKLELSLGKSLVVFDADCTFAKREKK